MRAFSQELGLLGLEHVLTADWVGLVVLVLEIDVDLLVFLVIGELTMAQFFHELGK